MKLAGVSIKKESLISKDDLIKLALLSPKYYQKRNALELINKEIKESGLYRQSKAKSKEPKVKRTKTNRRPNNNKQS